MMSYPSVSSSNLKYDNINILDYISSTTKLLPKMSDNINFIILRNFGILESYNLAYHHRFVFFKLPLLSLLLSLLLKKLIF